jgi:hypothetical protein
MRQHAFGNPKDQIELADGPSSHPRAVNVP